MKFEDTKTRVVSPTTGAVFHHCALQVNPCHYRRTFQGDRTWSDPKAYVESIVAKAVELDVTVLAITDHNDVESVPAFKNAAAMHGIEVFPGFELTSREGIHVLCLYAQETTQAELGRFLGEFGIRKTGPSTQLARQSFEQILTNVRAQGGMPIAAHVTSKRGLFNVLEGQARINAWRNANLSAIQIPGSVTDLPTGVRPIVENKNPDYLRDHPAGEGLAVAVINAADVKSPADLEHSAATCWIKMSEISIEGLRQAFLDPGSRIRLNSEVSEVEPDRHDELIDLDWQGGFLNGISIRLNPNLNVIVGGRGTGKSTVVESLRYVLGLEPIGEDALTSHRGIVRNVLRSGTKVTLRLRSNRPIQQIYQIERTVPNPPIVRNADGSVSSLLPKDIFPRVEVYGQHEISEITRSPEKLTNLLARFVESDISTAGRKSSVLLALARTRTAITANREELTQIDEQLSALPGLEETLDRYREAGLEDLLRDRSHLVREAQILDSISERLGFLRESEATLRSQLPIDLAFLSESALEGLPGQAILSDVNGPLSELSRDLEQVVSQMREAFGRADQAISDLRERWGNHRSEIQSTYEQTLRDLQEQAVDGDEFIRLREAAEALRPLRDRHQQLVEAEAGFQNQRRELLVEWEDLKAEGFRSLDEAAVTVSERLRGFVQVQVTASGNRQPLFDLLRAEVGGQLAATIERLDGLEALSLVEFAMACRSGAQELQDKFKLTTGQANNIAEVDPEVFMKVEELDLPAITDIQLNTARSGDTPFWRPLDNLSTGQKATAVLLLLLLESEAPLIIDQPEDDLDNRFITDGVVPRMRSEKRRRQFLFSTHNANVPVLGDAELIVGISTSGASARILPEHVGSIDSSTVREMVEEILEGGKDAFETRRLKYGF